MSNKTERIHLRLEPEFKQRIARAALISDYSVSTFIVRSAVEYADEILKHGDEEVLSFDEWNTLQRSLIKPPSSSKALKRAFKAYKRMSLDSH